MDRNEFLIQITSAFDSGGIDAAKQKLAELTGGTTTAGKETAELGHRAKGLSQTIQGLQGITQGGALSLHGMATAAKGLTTAFTGLSGLAITPFLAMAGSLVFAYQRITDAVDKYTEKILKAPGPVEAWAANVTKLTEAYAAFRAESDRNTASTTALNAAAATYQQTQNEIALQTIELERQRALQGAKTPEEKNAVNIKHDSDRSRLDSAFAIARAKEAEKQKEQEMLEINKKISKELEHQNTIITTGAEAMRQARIVSVKAVIAELKNKSMQSLYSADKGHVERAQQLAVAERLLANLSASSAPDDYKRQYVESGAPDLAASRDRVQAHKDKLATVDVELANAGAQIRLSGMKSVTADATIDTRLSDANLERKSAHVRSMTEEHLNGTAELLEKLVAKIKALEDAARWNMSGQ